MPNVISVSPTASCTQIFNKNCLQNDNDDKIFRFSLKSKQLTWNGLPRNMKNAVKSFLWAYVTYVIAHLLALLFTFSFNHEDIIVSEMDCQEMIG